MTGSAPVPEISGRLVRCSHLSALNSQGRLFDRRVIWRIDGTPFGVMRRAGSSSRWGYCLLSCPQELREWAHEQGLAEMRFDRRQEAVSYLVATWNTDPPQYQSEVRLRRQSDGSYLSSDGHWQVTKAPDGDGWFLGAYSPKAQGTRRPRSSHRSRADAERTAAALSSFMASGSRVSSSIPGAW